VTPKQDSKPLENQEPQARFYLIFDELAKVGATSVSDVNLEEFDEIEQVRQMVTEVTDDRPIFMTST